MAYDSSKALKKAGTQPAPQYWNDDTGDWEVVMGAGGAYRIQTPVDVAEDTYSGAGNLTVELASEMNGLVVSNDGNADLTFTVSGKTRTVKAGEVYTGMFRPFDTFTITSAIPWRVDVIKTIGAVASVVTPPDTTAPDNVTNLVASAVEQTTLTLTWDASASSDVAGYDVYRGTTLLTTVTGTTYNVTGLTENTAYTFTVKAKDAAGNVASGTQVPVTTADVVPDIIAPEPVTGLTTGTTTSSTIPLTWTDSISSDVASFEVAYSTNGTNFTVAAAALSAASTSYTVTGLAAETSYTLRVVAIDGADNRSTAATVTQSTSAAADTTAPDPVTNLTAGTPTDTIVPLTWTASGSSDIAAHEVAYSTDGTTFTVASAAVAAGATSYTVTGLTAETAYTFRVVVVDTSGNRSTDATTTATTEAAGGAITDSFNRADSTTSIGNTDTGEAWVPLIGTWGISNNQAYQPSVTANSIAVIESGLSDCEIQCTFAVNAANMRIAFRVQDENNFLMVQSGYLGGAQIALFKYVAGVYTVIAHLPSTGDDGDVYKVILSGTSVKVYTNDALIIDEVVTEFVTETKHGLLQGTTADGRFDDFSITALN